MATQPLDFADTDPVQLDDHRPVFQRRVRHDGWPAQRQRMFLTVLAETGCI